MWWTWNKVGFFHSKVTETVSCTLHASPHWVILFRLTLSSAFFVLSPSASMSSNFIHIVYLLFVIFLEATSLSSFNKPNIPPLHMSNWNPSVHAVSHFFQLGHGVGSMSREPQTSLSTAQLGRIQGIHKLADRCMLCLNSRVTAYLDRDLSHTLPSPCWQHNTTVRWDNVIFGWCIS